MELYMLFCCYSDKERNSNVPTWWCQICDLLSVIPPPRKKIRHEEVECETEKEVKITHGSKYVVQ
jgi:hypothetical protein